MKRRNKRRSYFGPQQQAMGSYCNPQQQAGGYDNSSRPQPFAVYVEGKPMIGVVVYMQDANTRMWNWMMANSETIIDNRTDHAG